MTYPDSQDGSFIRAERTNSPEAASVTGPQGVLAGAYQTHIDGLRAIAVLAVIANHFDKSWLPGGYLGVDIFFVISGFVITASLSSRPRQQLGSFLQAFFQRRIKRLLPALLVCVLVTSALISVLDPQPHVSLWTGISALFGFSNLYLYLQAVDYFAPSAQSNVFLQTWSLGVEEQFYLVYPLLFWLATSGRLGKPGRALPLLIGCLSVISFATFVWLFGKNPAAAYFLTPARFWELGAGCLLFAGRQSTPIVWLQKHLSALGVLPLLVLVASLWAPIDLLVVATATAVVLTCLLLLGPTQGSFCQRVLTWPPLRHIGLISYSLYLWHWAVLAIARWSFGVNAATLPWLLVAMFLLAQVSYRWVETPFRQWQGNHTVKRGLSASLLATTIAVALLSHHTRLLLPLDSSIAVPAPFLPVRGLPFNPTCVVDDDTRKLETNTFDLCTEAPRAPENRTLWVMGDSHAGHLQGMLPGFRTNTGSGIHLIETPGRAYPYSGPAFEPRERIVAAMHERARPGDVLLVSRLFLQRDSDRLMADLPAWEEALQQLAHQLQKRQMHLVVMGPPPMFNFDSVAVCQRKLSGRTACELDRETALKRVDQVHRTLEQRLATVANAHVFRSFDILCPASGDKCSPLRDRMLIYRDRDHLNTEGASLLTEPFQQFMQKRGLLGLNLQANGSENLPKAQTTAPPR